MSEYDDWNASIISEFRANEGRVGGQFEGADLILLHHRGRKSGREYVSPLMCLVDEANTDSIYIFGSAAGAPKHPQWYQNITSAGQAEIERGTEKYTVIVEEVVGDKRDKVYAEQARQYPFFAEYEKKTAGIRTIPVVALRRA
ncbi:nitroreductase family deazaflavin-dependent oxidoreductase [Hoyosella rhizosphaerae]|uniref:Nitroreductase family deazaflavin-dependent oxidoreductase n=1 Tax=Hoyosella rhizosphaerae TaxID=1755582 RepID=A0A916U0G0_9ACTN|nr:nitroreductase/quinone reductase family protein [Hoyosella rhizosphaerae]MBN4927166.1 nitroreductase family deazaflavin-dependent oxidoreductase [Hoyosella rhizosphaerae]GGC53491.1 hypothetical protein GCM10011410_02310 [Hoyosella rhizosphaerae]